MILTPTPVLYAMRPSGPEITRRALLRRLRQRGVCVVDLPAGHYIFGEQRPAVDGVVAEINANLRLLAIGNRPAVEARLEVLFRPIPTPTDSEAG